MFMYHGLRARALGHVRPGVWFAVPLTALLATFLLDLLQPADVLFSILYVVPIVLTIGIGQARVTYLIFVLASVATVAAAAFSATPAHPTAALSNRALALVAQVLAAAVVIQQLELRARQLSATVEQTQRLAQAEAETRWARLRLDRLQQLIAASPEGVIVLDAGGLITEVNPAALQILDLDSEHLRGRHWREFIPFLAVTGAHGEALGGGVPDSAWPSSGVEAFETEIRLQRARGGDIVRCLLSASAVSDREGSGGGVVMLRDITALRGAERQKDEFLSMATHELRTPIATLRGYVQMAQAAAQRTGAVEIGTMVGKTLRQVDRLNTLMLELFDVSRIHSGQLELRLVTLDLPAMVREAVDHVQTSSPGRGIDLSIAEPIPLLQADAQRLEQVLNNLLDNAIKYSPDGGPIWVRLLHAGNEVQLTVTDTGVGIPQEEQTRLFQRFYRGQSKSQRFSGLGVGLYISRQIVHQHGGRMWVQSAPGKGSTFGFALPVVAGSQTR